MRPEVAGVQIVRKVCLGLRPATFAEQSVQLDFENRWVDWGDFDDLVSPRRGILAGQQRAAGAALIWLDHLHLVDVLWRCLISPSAQVAGLASPLLPGRPLLRRAGHEWVVAGRRLA